MSSLICPNREMLKQWSDYLGRSTVFSGQELPDCDEEWLMHMEDALHLIQLPGYPDDIYGRSAYLFYTIAKGHRLVNENKRSAVIVLYLFCIINDYVLIATPDELLRVAEDTAKSKAQEHEAEVERLQGTLKKLVRKI